MSTHTWSLIGQGIYDDILYHGSVYGLGTGGKEVQPNLIEGRPSFILVNLIQDDGWDSFCVAEPDVLFNMCPAPSRKAKVRPGQLVVQLKHEAAANKRRLVSQLYASHSCSYSSFPFPFLSFPLPFPLLRQCPSTAATTYASLRCRG